MNRYPSQLLVLGRGLQPNGEPTSATRERATSAAHYFHEFGAETIIFSGGKSVLSGGSATEMLSEAELMTEIAVLRGVPDHVVKTEPTSKTTVENIVNSLPLLDVDKPVGILAHGDQLPRAMFIGSLAITGPIIGIEALGIYKNPKAEKALMLATRLMLLGVEAGEISNMTKREQRVAGLLSHHQNVLSLLRKYHPAFG